MPETAFCYHCAIHHPIEEMQQILTKNAKRWRCIKSIELTKQGGAKREAFDRQTAAKNKADTHAKICRMVNPERNQHS